MIIRSLVLAAAFALFAVPSTSHALAIFHSATDDGNNASTLMLSSGASGTVNLWIDLMGVQGVAIGASTVSSSGTMTFDFTGLIPNGCTSAPGAGCATAGQTLVQFFGGDDETFFPQKFKVASIIVNADGGSGDMLMFDGGSVFDGSTFDEPAIPGGVILAKVPEPATLVLLGLGLGSVAFLRRRENA